MLVDELLGYRSDFLDQAKDDYGFVSQNLVLSEMLPFLVDAKLLDSEDFNDLYLINPSVGHKLNGYTVNETGERLQLFIVDEESIDESKYTADLLVSERLVYESQFKRVTKLLRAAISGLLQDTLQDSDPMMALANQLHSEFGMENYDVFEIFLVSLTATVSFKASEPQPKQIHVSDEVINLRVMRDGRQESKEILVKRRVIDLNFLGNAIASRGLRESLEVQFKDKYLKNIEVIKAADQANFSSFLCVLDADVIFDLYRSHGTRLLEKNVRSFLSFKGVNKGIKSTIRNEPERFIAYNNGLTITASDIKVFVHKKRTYLDSLTDFQIVNGGQTTATIFFSKREGLNISNVKVMAKINVAKSDNEDDLEDLISNISMYSNSQSRVSSVDLRARSSQLVQLSQLSESVSAPNGDKWFFERAKGEFNTQARRAGASAARLRRQYPVQRRFSKEQLAKYFCAWGDQPHLVKKGGEKVFRFLMEVLTGDDDNEAPQVNRDFYEELIAKIILFRRLEKIYGQGPNAIGQLRSAVVPYSIATLYIWSDGANENRYFDLAALWKEQDLAEDLAQFFKELMCLMNGLIKQYSASDDYGEYSKKPELWEAISRSPELTDFRALEETHAVLDKYIKEVTQRPS